MVSVRQMEMWEGRVGTGICGLEDWMSFRDCPILQVRKTRLLQALKGAAGIRLRPLAP